MQRIEALLRKEIGLDAASIGSSLIERTIRLRMKQHGLKHVQAYRDLLAHSAAELRELIESVVVTETWFFRDREPFNAFVHLVQTEWLPRHPVGPLRVLSVPCSSGEEPYSLAMALLDAGVPDTRFVIDAVDISTNALARAEKAVYGKNSFRGRDLAFRDRHFRPCQDGMELNPSVRATVRFHRDNILDDGFLAGGAPYDFVFCRNLLIYFDRSTQVLVLEKLYRLLAREGVLFVGPAEMPLATEGGFVSANLPLAFACRKFNAESTHSTKSHHRKSTPARHPGEKSSSGKAKPVHFTDTLQRLPGAAHAIDHVPTNLEVARQLADGGKIEEAGAICEAHLARNGASAEAYYLLGLMKDAVDDPEAITFYRKALYLEPNHYEALVHAALWLEKVGDVIGARPFKRRAERAQVKESTGS
ncbi:MAG TPA: CheR family methyltransferase [Verrucomicrobiae bacterium]|nr:CheR family methyltransferase [Verrucomicrobiae bacterium]